MNTKGILVEEQKWYPFTHSWGDKGVQTFPNSIRPKLNILVQLEIEIANYDLTVEHFSTMLWRFFIGF